MTNPGTLALFSGKTCMFISGHYKQPSELEQFLKKQDDNQQGMTIEKTLRSIWSWNSDSSNLFLVSVSDHVLSPESETFSRSFPSTLISSLIPVCSQVTPSNILTTLTCFSPRKFRTSTLFLSSEVLMFIGKWAYTAFILYR